MVGRRDLNSGPLVPQTAPVAGRRMAGCGAKWTFFLQIEHCAARTALPFMWSFQRFGQRMGNLVHRVRGS